MITEKMNSQKIEDRKFLRTYLIYIKVPEKICLHNFVYSLTSHLIKYISSDPVLTLLILTQTFSLTRYSSAQPFTHFFPVALASFILLRPFTQHINKLSCPQSHSYPGLTNSSLATELHFVFQKVSQLFIFLLKLLIHTSSQSNFGFLIHHDLLHRNQ